MSKNERQIQRERVVRILQEQFPDVDPQFDDESPNVKFVLRGKGLSVLLTDVINWQPDEASRMTDLEIVEHLKTMGGGRVRLENP